MQGALGPRKEHLSAHMQMFYHQNQHIHQKLMRNHEFDVLID
jgi:hypothetical protein